MVLAIKLLLLNCLLVLLEYCTTPTFCDIDAITVLSYSKQFYRISQWFCRATMVTWSKLYRNSSNTYSYVQELKCICFQFDNVSVSSKRTIPAPGRLSKIAKSRLPGQFFWSDPGGGSFPGTLYFNKFYTFSPSSRHQSLIYSLHIYKFVGKT